MSIYTRTGDKGITSLATGERVAKTDPRLEAYGTADELNAWIGLLRACEDVRQWNEADGMLEWIQQRLFNIGAGLSGAEGVWVTEADVAQLEQWMDAMLKETPLVRAFVLPVGGESVGRIHVCRTGARRLERRILCVGEHDDCIIRYVNRLSDFFFVLARQMEVKRGENPQKWDKEAKCKKSF